MNRTVSVLFARKNSIYKSLCSDVWDEQRNALLFPGPNSVIAHPPCRGWGRLRTFAKVAPGELEMGLFAVEQVRRFGGVVEHPCSSLLFPAAGCLAPGAVDSHGGFLTVVYQSWFGHRAPKPTMLYICGIAPNQIPDLPLHLGIPDGRIENMGRPERESTPAPFALWLLDLASRVNLAKTGLNND